MKKPLSYAAAEAAAGAVGDDQGGPLFSPPPRQRHSDTSAAAGASVEGVAGFLRGQVYGYLEACGPAGATDEEIQAATGMPANTERPRRVELTKALLIHDTGTRARTKSGRTATRWAVGAPTAPS